MKIHIPVCTFLLLLSFMMIVSYNCQKSENIKTSLPKPEKILSDEIQINPSSPPNRIKILQLDSDTVYILNSNLTRENGESINIEPGTLIKVSPGIGITIKPGGIINAKGNGGHPVVFTGNLPTGNRNNYWNGITINGKAPNNNGGTINDSLDNSGILSFVRIEFAPLILNSVGNNTIMLDIQVSYSNNMPSFTFNGGNCNAHDLISFACGASTDFYFTGGYRGRMQYLYALRHPFFGEYSNQPSTTVAGIYIENNPFNPLTASPITCPAISNATIIGPDGNNGSSSSYSDTVSGDAAALITTNNTLFVIRNSLFLGYPTTGWKINEINTIKYLENLKSEFKYSVVQCNYNNRAFVLKDGVYPPFTSSNFEGFILDDRFHNKKYNSTQEFQFLDPFNYNYPQPTLTSNATLLSGANFDGSEFSHSFFQKSNYIGAFGESNWMKEWANFNPLKTDYNQPK